MNEMETTDRGAGSVFFSFLAGAAIGAGIGLLLAPKAGAEMRGQIKDMANDAMGKGKEYIDKTKDYARNMRGRAGEMVDQGKETLQEGKEKMMDAGKSAMEEEKPKYV